MNNRIALQWLAIHGIILAAFHAAALGVRLADQDAFATARGEAFTATADNPSAIYYNPAGLTQLSGTTLRSGIYGIYFDPTFRPPAGRPNSGSSYSTKNEAAAVPQLFLARTLKSIPLSLGLGMYAPFGGGVSWAHDTGFYSVAAKSALTYLRFNPVAALKLPAGFSLGAGLTLNYAKLYLAQGLRPTDAPLANYFRFKGDGWSAGFNLGLLWQPQEKISFGATFRSATSFRLSGYTEFVEQPVIQVTRLPAVTDLTFPWNGVLGVSFRPTPDWNLEFDADYTQWRSMGIITLRQQQTPPFPVQQIIPVHLDWRPSWNYSVGVTRYLTNGWRVSAGYLYTQNSVPDKFYTPLVPDLDRHFVSIGVGRTGKRLDFDLAYQFGYGPARTVLGSTPASTPGQFAGQNADGTYDFISHAVIATLGLHF